jgi:enoyl-CoA hydratase
MHLETDKMLAVKDGGVGWITFNNPERRNAMSLEMWQALGTIVDDFAADPDVRVVVMQGAGEKSFVSGGDISQYGEKRSNAADAETYALVPAASRARLSALEKPVIAMIRGYCLGGGLSIALRADIRIAADDARFSIPAAKLGIAYAHDSLEALVALIGPGAARDMLFSARMLDAAEALQIRLVNRVVPAADLVQVTTDYAAVLAENAPLSMRASKVAVNQLVLAPGERDRGKINELARLCFDSGDYAEGRLAFSEKRKPKFTGS